jgi:hypothetical protein
MNASEQITKYIDGLADWRGKTVAQLRKLIRDAAPDAVGAFQDHVKVNFFKGASLADPHRLFNAGHEAKASRAIDIHQGDRINTAALQDLVRAAVALNGGKAGSARGSSKKR